MTNHDLKGVLANMTPKAAIMGTGPGEIWSGPDEIKAAYEHFFQNFDKGHHKFDYQFKSVGWDPIWAGSWPPETLMQRRTEKHLNFRSTCR